MKQTSLFDDEVISMKELYFLLCSIEQSIQANGAEKGNLYSVYVDKGSNVQINIYKGYSTIIQKGVYLSEQRDGTYRISHFSSNVLPPLCNYALQGTTQDETKFLNWFVNQNPIVYDLEDFDYYWKTGIIKGDKE